MGKTLRRHQNVQFDDDYDDEFDRNSYKKATKRIKEMQKIRSDRAHRLVQFDELTQEEGK